VCADRELVDLGKAVEARFRALVAQADPLMALLLRRDQVWFTEVLGGGGAAKFEGQKDPERLRLKDTLARRLATLNAIKPRAIAAGPAGAWANALASVAVSEAAGGMLRVSLTAKLAYVERDDTLTCSVAGTFKADRNEWFAGTLTDRDGTRAQARVRLQGNTLRIVHDYDEDATQHVCGLLGILTGSYFPTNPAAPGTAAVVAARTVSPSFKCATAENADEKEICADPEVAARDADIARAYGDTLRRLDSRLAAELRRDQRRWVKDNPTAYDDSLHPAANKSGYMLHFTDAARGELMRRLDERLAMLVNLDEKREGVVGLWEAYNAALAIAPAKGKSDGSLTAEGVKWEVGDYKSRCDFKSDGRIEAGTFRATERFPTLTRDGALLITSAEDPDGDDNPMPPGGHAGFCNRLHSAKARLFPVKPAAGVGAKFDRYR
jgi:uncharacterized protein YecT (DUF1311 family)